MHNSKKRVRFWELDFIRGLCVMLMVFDHAMQLMFLSDNMEMQAKLIDYLDSPLQQHGQTVIRIIFFLICGISCVLSRSNGRRGLQLFGLAASVSVVTILLDTTVYFSENYVTIIFGVLHMLAVAILFCSVLMVLSDSIPYIGKFLPSLVGVFLLFFYYCYMKGKHGDANLGFFPEILGYELKRFYGADYAQLLPEMCYVLIGSGIGQFYLSRFKYLFAPLDGLWNKPICFIGKHALIIYIVQPIVLGAFYTFY